MSSSPDTNALRKILIHHASRRTTLDYKQLTLQLEIKPPKSIKQVTDLLEACQEDDALLQRAQLAAITIQKTGPKCPRPGFFQKLKALNLYAGADQGPQAEMWHQNELEKVFLEWEE